MLESLESVNWGMLSHAYGAAFTIPSKLRDLASGDSQRVAGALSHLYDCICHQECTVYQATVATVPFLIELFAAPAVQCRARILKLLGDIVRAAHSTSLAPDYSLTGDERRWAEECHQAVWRGIDVYLLSFGDLDTRIRTVAPYTVSLLYQLAYENLPGESCEAGRSIPKRLLAHITEEPNELARASFIFGLAAVAARCQQYAKELPEFLRNSESDVVRIAAATSLVGLDTNPSLCAVDILVDALGRWEQTDHSFGQNNVDPTEEAIFPWFEGWPRFTFIRRLCCVPSNHAKRVIPAFLAAIRHDNRFTDGDVSLPILESLLGSMRLDDNTKLADLNPEQHAALTAIYENSAMWDTSYGLMSRALMFLGLDDPKGRERLENILERTA